MKSKWTIILASAVLLSACTAAVKPATRSISNSLDSTTTNTKSSSQTIKTTGHTYMASDVAKHNKASDCWMIIDGSVYDLTKFINLHPGGGIISLGCGKDASILYNTRGGRGGGHSASADRMKQDYYIGDLAT